MTECVFCNLISNGSVVIFNTELTAVLLDYRPASLGHALIIPRIHRVDISEMQSDELAELLQIAQRLARFYDETFRPDGYNIFMNVGTAAGQEIMHAHLHLVPRQQDDGLAFHPSKPELSPAAVEQFNSKMLKQIAQL